MGKWFSEIGPYLADMFRHTVGKLTGFLSIVLGIAPIAYPPFFAGDQGILHTRSIWWIAASIAFFLASMAAWSEQHAVLLAYQKELDDRQPKFELAIANLNREYNAEKNETNYMLSVILLNRGASSVAVGWAAIYQHKEEPDEIMKNQYLGKPYILTQPDGKVTLTNESLIQTKTLTHPLGSGDARTGRILFALSGNRLGTKDFKIELSCYDIARKRYTALYVPAPTETIGIQFFPDEQVTLKAASQTKSTSS